MLVCCLITRFDMLVQYLIGFLVGIGFVVVIDRVMNKCDCDGKEN